MPKKRRAHEIEEVVAEASQERDISRQKKKNKLEKKQVGPQASGRPRLVERNTTCTPGSKRNEQIDHDTEVYTQ